LLFLALTKVQSEDVNIECQFSVPAGTSNYLCEVSGLTFSGDENTNFVFGGTHLVARTNEHVTHVTIHDSQVPFVIPQVFTTFPNMIHMNFNRGGLTRIQSNAVVEARRLEIFTARHNPELTRIHSNAFSGATNLLQVILSNNSIHDVHEQAFVGLQRTRVINLSNNKIRKLPEDVFRPARRLETLFFRNNQIETLYASMFAHNNIMNQIELHDNRINAIDRNFFVSIRELTWLMLLRNVCANRTFVFGMTEEQIIKEGLAPCFENFDRMTRKLAEN
jgi:Leucine rich repeat